MNYGMPGTNNHCYTEATGQPAKRNCSSGWTKQQRAPVNSSQLRPTTASFAQYCYSRSFGERKRFLNSRAFHNGAARFADSQIGTTPTIFTLDPFTPTRFIRYFALFQSRLRLVRGSHYPYRSAAPICIPLQKSQLSWCFPIWIFCVAETRRNLNVVETWTRSVRATRVPARHGVPLVVRVRTPRAFLGLVS